MRSLVIALASALLLAVVVTEFSQRLWPQSYLGLFFTAAFVLFINGLFNVRLYQGSTQPVPEVAARQSRANNKSRKNDKRSNDKRGKESKPQHKSDRGRDAQRSKSQTNNANSSAGVAAPVPSGPRETGEVKWFNRSKGFGFIIRSTGDEIFVHQRSIRGSNDDGRARPILRDGEAVEFVVTEHDKGLQAEDVVATERG